MRYRLILRPAAEADLRETYIWYEARQPGLGAEFMEAAERKLLHIESNPLQFPELRSSTRRAIIARFPYGIFYVLQGQSIAVLAVMHHARAPLRWQGRI